jgi:hypothetical protein
MQSRRGNRAAERARISASGSVNGWLSVQKRLPFKETQREYEFTEHFSPTNSTADEIMISITPVSKNRQHETLAIRIETNRIVPVSQIEHIIRMPSVFLNFFVPHAQP